MKCEVRYIGPFPLREREPFYQAQYFPLSLRGTEVPEGEGTDITSLRGNDGTSPEKSVPPPTRAGDRGRGSDPQPSSLEPRHWFYLKL